MTGYTVHTGSTEKFSDGWDVIFSKRSRGAARKANRIAKPAKKSAAAKKAAKRGRKKSG